MKTVIILILVLTLTGCASTGSKLVMDYPTQSGIMRIEATGDVTVNYNKETGDVDFITEQVKQETVEAINTNMLELWKILGK